MAEGVKVVGICPIMLDTPMNRKYMAEGTDTSSWTPLSKISRYYLILEPKLNIVNYLNGLQFNRKSRVENFTRLSQKITILNLWNLIDE